MPTGYKLGLVAGAVVLVLVVGYVMWQEGGSEPVTPPAEESDETSLNVPAPPPQLSPTDPSMTRSTPGPAEMDVEGDRPMDEIGAEIDDEASELGARVREVLSAADETAGPDVGEPADESEPGPADTRPAPEPHKLTLPLPDSETPRLPIETELNIDVDIGESPGTSSPRPTPVPTPATTKLTEPSEPDVEDEVDAAPPEPAGPTMSSLFPEPAEEPTPSELATGRSSPATPAVPRQYTIQSGDNFSKLGERFYGSESAWVDIAQANPTVDPEALKVGQVIRLPRPQDVGRTFKLAPDEQTQVPPPSDGPPNVIVVEKGDTLSDISQRAYGTARHWRAIYEANRDKLKSPDIIRPGIVLEIPPKPE